MKGTNFFTLTLVFGALLVLGASNAAAQSGVAPSGQSGVGIVAGTGGNVPVGATYQYAFSPSFVLGAGLGLDMASVNSVSTTNYSFEVFGRWLFEGKVNPFAQVALRLNGFDNGVTTSTQKILYAGFGLQYFMNQNVGVYSMLEIVTLNLESGGGSQIGLRAPRVGLEWYFNK